MVLGLLRVCAEMGIRVPEDLAIVTNDNPTIMGLPGIDVTTISISMESMAQNAVDIFRIRVKEPEGKKKTIVLQPEIIVRKSSGEKKEDL
jgi:LacI family transcriptional regulator